MATVTTSSTTPTYDSSQFKWGTGSVFVDASRFVDISPTKPLVLDGDFTVQGWVRIAEDHWYQCLFEIGNNSTNSLLVRIRDATTANGTANGNGSVLVNGATIPDVSGNNFGRACSRNTWAYICINRDKGEVKVYVNGVLRASSAGGSVSVKNSAAATINTNGKPIRIGWQR